MTRNERSKLSRYRLGEPLTGQLSDYCEAFDDATAATVIKKALRAYIQAQLDANPGVKAAYEALRGKRQPGLKVVSITVQDSDH